MRRHGLWMVMIAAALLIGREGVAEQGASPGPSDAQATAPRDFGGGPRHRHGLSPGQIEDALHVVRRIDADAADRLERLRATNPGRLAAELRRRLPRIEGFLALKRYDPPMFELRVEDLRLTHSTRVLADRLRQAGQPDGSASSQAIREALQRAVQHHFDVRQQIREGELARLEQRINQLREQLQARAADREALIAQRIEELTRDGAPTQW